MHLRACRHLVDEVEGLDLLLRWLAVHSLILVGPVDQHPQVGRGKLAVPEGEDRLLAVGGVVAGIDIVTLVIIGAR